MSVEKIGGTRHFGLEKLFYRGTIWFRLKVGLTSGTSWFRLKELFFRGTIWFRLNFRLYRGTSWFRLKLDWLGLGLGIHKPSSTLFY